MVSSKDAAYNGFYGIMKETVLPQEKNLLKVPDIGHTGVHSSLKGVGDFFRAAAFSAGATSTARSGAFSGVATWVASLTWATMSLSSTVG